MKPDKISKIIREETAKVLAESPKAFKYPIDDEDAQPRDMAKAVKELQKLGMELGTDFFLKSGQSWIDVKHTGADVAKLLTKYRLYI